jgi:Arc/MetJ family transcription regulator
MKLANVKTKREAVDVALRKFVQRCRQRKMLERSGTGDLLKDYDYKGVRIAKGPVSTQN